MMITKYIWNTTYNEYKLYKDKSNIGISVIFTPIIIATDLALIPIEIIVYLIAKKWDEKKDEYN